MGRKKGARRRGGRRAKEDKYDTHDECFANNSGGNNKAWPQDSHVQRYQHSQAMTEVDKAKTLKCRIVQNDSPIPPKNPYAMLHYSTLKLPRSSSKPFRPCSPFPSKVRTSIIILLFVVCKRSLQSARSSIQQQGGEKRRPGECICVISGSK